MSSNGRLDVSTLIDWDGRQNYLDPEAARQWIAARSAYAAVTGYWLYTSECYRPVGEPGDLDRGTINTQWYWKEWWTRAGIPGNAATPGTTSTHGWGKGIDLVGWPEHVELESTMAAHGWLFNVPGEPWHLSYVGNPSIVAPSLTDESPIRKRRKMDKIIIGFEDTGKYSTFDIRNPAETRERYQHIGSVTDLVRLEAIYGPRQTYPNQGEWDVIRTRYGLGNQVA